MPLPSYQTYQEQNFSAPPRKKSPLFIISAVIIVIIAITAFLYFLGSADKDGENVPQAGEILSEQEKLEILKSLSDESIARPSAEERQAILEGMSLRQPSLSEQQPSLSEEEKLEIIKSLQFQ